MKSEGDMITAKISSNILLSDSIFNTFSMLEDSTLVVQMSDWQELPFRIIFYNTIKMLYKQGDHPKELCIGNEDSEFFVDALLDYYGFSKKDHNLKLYQIEDIDDIPLLTVVAESCSIEKG